MRLKCWRCKEYKDVSEFRLKSWSKRGFDNECKKCKSEMAKEHRRDIYRTLKRIYKYHIKYLKMTFDDFQKWAFDNDYEKMYNLYVLSQYSDKYKPALKIIDKTKPFSYDNIKLTYIGELLSEHSNQKKKKVMQFTLDEEFIKTYDSISKASEETLINKGLISKAINGKVKHAGGYIWKKWSKDLELALSEEKVDEDES